MAHTQKSQRRISGVPRWVVLASLALALLLAVALIAIGARRSRGSAEPVREAGTASGAAGEMTGSGSSAAGDGEAQRDGVTSTGAASSQGAGSPKSTVTGLPPGMRLPSTPDTSAPSGYPPTSIAGVYRVTYTFRADTCAHGATNSTHDIEVAVDGQNVNVKDRLTGHTMSGPGGSDGRIAVSFTKEDRSFSYRELMTAVFDGSTVQGRYYTYLNNFTCVVEHDIEGGRA